MNRPYIICHMLTSIDGKVTGDFLFQDSCAEATEIYYRRDAKPLFMDADMAGFSLVKSETENGNLVLHYKRS